MECLFAELVHLANGGRESERGGRERVFREWLKLNLEEQCAELRRYLDGQEDPTALLRRWARERWYERLIPACARLAERELFVSDFEIIAAVTYSDLQPENANPDLVRSGRVSSNRRFSRVKMKIGELKGALHFPRWTAGHRCRFH